MFVDELPVQVLALLKNELDQPQKGNLQEWIIDAPHVVLSERIAMLQFLQQLSELTQVLLKLLDGTINIIDQLHTKLRRSERN